MSASTAKSVASPNIAFIKYWGNREHTLRIPSNRSFSMTLGGLETETSVTLLEPPSDDVFILNGTEQVGESLNRVSSFLSTVRTLAGREEAVRVVSRNSFPAGSGIASSAAAFSALALAASEAFSLHLSPVELSILARRGSGSAARSVFGGFVEMNTGKNDVEAFASPFLPPEHWQLHDWIAVVDKSHKSTGSSQGHALAETSPIQTARIKDTKRRMKLCQDALKNRDFEAFAEIVEQDSNLMHAVMLTSTPSLLYLLPASLQIMRSVKAWRKEGIEACFTIDAGPNVHVISTPEYADVVKQKLHEIEAVGEIIHAVPGRGARLIDA
ncbi:MAG: diphosphomevalonate decarboxylase [Anaerolineales bacterium]|jgi:diphosphomevalonate decarboxylase